ncbi:MAG: hypothetical protein RLZZ627_759, partial [Pseudomonadota bacterium]
QTLDGGLNGIVKNRRELFPIQHDLSTDGDFIHGKNQ